MEPEQHLEEAEKCRVLARKTADRADWLEREILRIPETILKWRKALQALVSEIGKVRRAKSTTEEQILPLASELATIPDRLWNKKVRGALIKQIDELGEQVRKLDLELQGYEERRQNLEQQIVDRQRHGDQVLAQQLVELRQSLIELPQAEKTHKISAVTKFVLRDLADQWTTDAVTKSVTECRSAIQMGDLPAAAVKSGAATSRVKKLQRVLRNPSFELCGGYCDRFQVDVRDIDMGEFAGPLGDLRNAVRDIVQEVDELDDQIAELLDQQQDPQSASDVEQQQEIFARVLRTNKAIVVELKRIVQEAGRLIQESTRIRDTALNVQRGELAGDVMLELQRLHDDWRQAQESFQTNQYPMRKGEGDSSTSDLSREDRNSLAPLNTQSMQLQKKLGNTADIVAEAAQEALEHLATTFQTPGAADLKRSFDWRPSGGVMN